MMTIDELNDQLADCKKGDHDLKVIVQESCLNAAGYVVRWCKICGSVVVDAECDNRVYPGRVMKMIGPGLYQEFRKKTKKYKKVLVIDHDKFSSGDMKFFIEDEGHSCTVCSDTNNFMELWDSIEEFDLIFIELMMLRGKNFFTLKNNEKDLDTGEIIFKRIRKKYRKKEIVIVTAKNKEDISINTKKVSIIHKPLNDEKWEKFIEYLKG
jgi:CheY-like chemotaxis protein